MNAVTFPTSPQTRTPNHWLARSFSALLLIAIAVLGSSLFVAGRELRTLKSELTSLRSEAGHLVIYDRSKVYVTRVKPKQPNEWAWRVYLPGNHTFALFDYRGRMPTVDPAMSTDWQRQISTGDGSMGGVVSGEFIIRWRLERLADGRWASRLISGDTLSRTTGLPHSPWLANRDWEESSAIPAEGQREFPREATFDLIRLRQESAVDSDDPERRTETIALWLTGGSTSQ
jgi:hypothetical protein